MSTGLRMNVAIDASTERVAPQFGPSVERLGPRATYRRFLIAILVWAAVGLFGCQGDVTEPPPAATNAAPQLAGSIPAQTVYVGERISVDLATHFSDPDGDALTYAVATSDSAVVGLTLSGSALGMVGRSQGVATVTATARDPGGLAAEQGFEVMVPNRAPEALGSMAERAMAAGDTATLDVSAYFTDPDGDALEYTAASSDSGTATVSMHGDVLEIVAVRWGAVTVTVTARDGGGLVAEQALSVVGANRMPVIVASLPDVEVEVGGEVVIVASRYFGDPDGDALVYRAEALDADVVGVVVVGDTVTVVGLARGRAAVVVAARDAGGLAARDTMGVVVPNQAPVVVESLPDVVLDEGADTVVVLSRYFRDPDGDELTYRATSSEPRVVGVEVAGDSLTVEMRVAGKAVVKVVAGDPGGLVVRGVFGVIPSDRETLKLLYHLTGGADWTNSENWLTEAPIDEWYGVTTDAAHQVLSIDLRSNRLVGPIPSELGRLSSLTSLLLSNNELAGPIPSELGQLSRLEHLDLSDNLLTDIAPELGQLSRLGSLSLGINQLTGPIPPELGQLSRLRKLDLCCNDLTGPVPAELGQLSSLRNISLYDNDLTGSIPPELGRLSHLIGISMSDNDLTGLIPSELGQLSNLTHLYLSANHLTGPVPADIGRLSRLRKLYLHGNDLTGLIPPELGQLSSLTHLGLSGNDLTGLIPPELDQLSSLTYLGLSGNDLTGPIPSELGQLSSLTHLYLSENHLTGPVPAELGQLSSLEWLILHFNELTGVVPNSFLNLEALEAFHFRSNHGLCAPDTEGFRRWLQGLTQTSGPFCPSGSHPSIDSALDLDSCAR